MFSPGKFLWAFFTDYPYMGWYFVTILLVASYLKSLGKKKGGYYRKWSSRWRGSELDLDEMRAYYSKPAMTWTEQGLYYRLLKALPDHMVLAQVQLTRILGVKEGYPYWVYHNRINQMSVDFLVCRKDGSVLAVIELDDSTHERADRKIADAKKDKALTSAGIRVIRWQAKSFPSVEMIGFYFSSDPIDPASQIAPRVSSD